MRDYSTRLAQLSPAKRSLLLRALERPARNGVQQEHRTVPGPPAEEGRLVAYVVPRQGHADPDPAELRSFLKQRLADYMIPAVFVPLPEVPRTPNGKVDREALPAPDAPQLELHSGFVAPRSPIEATLARIWSEVLGFDLVGVHDNYFEIGGDSILSIQIIARARQEGLHLKHTHLFEHPTVAELAAIAESRGARKAEQGPVSGPVPLTPIQHWFFDQALDTPHHWNQSIWLKTPPDVDPTHLESALLEVIRHHDALRVRFVKENSMRRALHAEVEDSWALSHVDLSDVPAEARASAMKEAALPLQESLDIEDGPLVAAALLDFGGGSAGRLLITVHHLVIDLLSWQILLEDLESAYLQLRRGQGVRLPQKTTSFKDWSEALATFSQSDDVLDESGFWFSSTGSRSTALPVDGHGPFTEASAQTTTMELTADESSALLHDVHAAYNTTTEVVLLTSLLMAYHQWTGERSLLLGLERHGREEIVDGLDLSRTVGWFTSFFPLTLTLDAPEPGSVLKTVKEQLRRVPRNGVGYGLLRYLRGDDAVAGKLRSADQPRILFNYAGRAGSPGSSNALLRPVGYAEISRARSNLRDHLLEVNAHVAEGRLRVTWTYSTNVHRRETIDALSRTHVDVLRSLIAHCQSADAGGYSPSDFPDAELSQEELDRFMGKLSTK